ncbi:hypothetical protein E2542_SST16519 [Spatholobus suberectus]|nr:hypothetical protein E2542_SST16519 [Spatholobus suberectus]
MANTLVASVRMCASDTEGEASSEVVVNPEEFVFELELVIWFWPSSKAFMLNGAMDEMQWALKICWNRQT